MLSRFGKIKQICEATSENTVTKEVFDWGDALIDAAISGAITFFSALGGASVSGSGNPLVAASISGASAFFAYLALKRKLVKKE